MHVRVLLSEKFISPPGASTRYASESTRALSGDRLIWCVEGGAGGGAQRLVISSTDCVLLWGTSQAP